MKKKEWRYLQGALDIEIGWDWSVGLGAPLGDGRTEKLNFSFQFQGFFLEKPKVSRYWVSNVSLTVNPQNLINFVGAIFKKIEIL